MNARSRGWEQLAPAIVLGAAGLLGLVATLQPTIALAAAVGLVLAFVVFSDLATGFAVLAFLSFLDTLPAAQSSISPAKGVGLLIAVAWLARFSATQRGERDFFRDHALLTWAMILFLAWGALSMLSAREPSASESELLRYAPNFLLLPIAYTAMRTRRDLAMVLGAIVLGSLLAAVSAVLSPAPTAELVEEGSRATGTIGDPNELAAVLLVGLAVGAGFALAKGRSPLTRAAGIMAVPLCAAGVFLSLSRGGLIALGALLVAGTIFAGRWRLPIIALLLAVAVGGVVYFTELAPLPARERITASNGGNGRTDLWTLGLRMVKAHPVTGVGLGNFPIVSADYAVQPGTIEHTQLIFATAPKVTHNTYLQIAAESGIPGIALFMATLLGCLRCALAAARSWGRRGEASMESLARGVFLGLVGLLVADFFISNMFSKLLWVLLALCPAMLAVARSEEREDAPAALV
jgi:O-antigen ligase